jgi:hypothetical protein
MRVHAMCFLVAALALVSALMVGALIAPSRSPPPT